MLGNARLYKNKIKKGQQLRLRTIVQKNKIANCNHIYYINILYSKVKQPYLFIYISIYIIAVVFTMSLKFYVKSVKETSRAGILSRNQS